MNVEEALKEAMRARVDEVYAPPSMGAAVRRRRRRSLTRFRTAGAVLVTAAVAVTVPIVLTSTAETSGPASESAPALAVPGIVVPDVVGMGVKEAFVTLEKAGFTPRIVAEGIDDEDIAVPPGTKVLQMDPSAGAVAEEAATVRITVPTPAPTASPEAVGKISDLGDLGDGLTWMGIHVGYLPEGVAWTGNSYEGGFGKKSATVPYAVAGLGEGMYSVQVIVTHEPSPSWRTGEKVGPGEAYLSVFDEGGQPAKLGPSTTLTATRFFDGGMAVQVLFSPDYSASLGESKARVEIVKVLDHIRQEK
ncbi:PASTA domain-containing protein [Herbidospora sp. RD11066]